MANLDSDAILTKLRAVLTTGAGSLRVIASGTYAGGVWDDLDDAEKVKRALHKPRVEPMITRVARNDQSPPWYGNLALYDLGVEVLVVRALQPEHKGDTTTADAARDDVGALAANDADVIAQAFCTLENLDSSSTDLVSGQLQWDESESEVVLGEEDAGRIETRHRFTGIAQVTLATS